MIGSKGSRHFFNELEAEPRQITPSTNDFSRPLSKLQVIFRSSDWFIAQFVPLVIGWSNYLVLVFRPSFENRYIISFIADPNKRLALFKKLEETHKLRDVKPPPTKRQPPKRVEYFAGEFCCYELFTHSNFNFERLNFTISICLRLCC